MKAMLAKNAAMEDLDRFVQDDAWFIEQKLDGHRIIVQVRDGEVLVMNRTGTRYMHHFPESIKREFAARFPRGAITLDGELVDGVFWVFDIMILQRSVMHRPFADYRRLALEHLFGIWSPKDVRLVPCAKDVDSKRELVRSIGESGGEGVMAKRALGVYNQGRSNDVLKVKFTKTAEVIVSEVGYEDKDAVRIALWHEGQLIHAGSINMIHHTDVLARLEPGQVIEVKYLYGHRGDDGFRFVQGIFLRERPDKDPMECTTGQMQFANKAVLV